MLSVEDAGLGDQVQWSEQAIHIRDFCSKHSVPNVVKVIKGQYRNIGVSKAVSNELYLHSVRTVSKVLAESVRVKEGKTLKMTVSEQKYSLPVSYKGWFELLSQDGKAIKAILSVQELARLFPQSCLVRENMKGFVHRGNGEVTLDGTRTVHAGEVLSLIGEVWVPFPMGKTVAKRRILKCVDAKGAEVFFGLEQKGAFSPIAGQNNISGVHTMKGLLDKFRLPLLVRLVHGVIPTKMEKGFTGVFRLVNIYSDENAFVFPLKKDAKMVPISTRETLKVVPVQNSDAVLSLERVQVVQKKCGEMLESYMNSIHILVNIPDVAAISKGKQDGLSDGPTPTDLYGKPGYKPSNADRELTLMSEVEEDLLFQEIDGIYQYVREGGAPPPDIKSRHPQQQARKDATVLDSLQVLNQPGMEIKMKQLDLPAEEEEDVEDTNHYRSVLPPKDNYNWVEPIYEPLDKIREQKKKSQEAKKLESGRRASATAAVVSSGFDSPPSRSPEDSSSSNGLDKPDGKQPQQPLPPPPPPPQPQQQQQLSPPQQQQPLPQPPVKRTAPLPPTTTTGSTPHRRNTDLGIPVSSLRQVMKGALQQDAAEPNSPALPSLPPKRFEERSTNIGPRNTCNTSSSSGSSNPSDKRLRHSNSLPAPSGAHPPYVAVARVGNYQKHTPAVLNNNNNDLLSKPRSNTYL